MRYKLLFHPEDYCIGENERFYTDMARRGWRLEHRGLQLSRFIKTEPTDDIYRIEVDYSEFDEEKLDLYADCGWEFVTKKSYVNVFRSSPGAQPPELYPDPREQAQTLRRMRRRTWITNLLLLPVVTAYLALMLSIGGGWRDVVAGIIKNVVMAPGIIAIYIVVLIYAIAIGIDGTLRISALYRRLKRGESLDHTPKKRPMVHKWAYFFAILLCFAVTAAQLAAARRGELPERSDGVYITLDELGYTGERYNMFDSSGVNILERIWSPTANITMAREEIRFGSGWVSFDQDIYELRIPALAEAFSQSVIVNSTFSPDPSEYEDIQVPGWDRVRTAYLDCVAFRGGDVVHLYMLTPQELSREDRNADFVRALELIGERLDNK